MKKYIACLALTFGINGIAHAINNSCTYTIIDDVNWDAPASAQFDLVSLNQGFANYYFSSNVLQLNGKITFTAGQSSVFPAPFNCTNSFPPLVDFEAEWKDNSDPTSPYHYMEFTGELTGTVTYLSKLSPSGGSSPDDRHIQPIPIHPQISTNPNQSEITTKAAKANSSEI